MGHGQANVNRTARRRPHVQRVRRHVEEDHLLVRHLERAGEVRRQPQLVEESSRPRTCRDHRLRGVDRLAALWAVHLHHHAVAVCRDATHLAFLLQHRAMTHRLRRHCFHGAVGIDDPGVGLVKAHPICREAELWKTLCQRRLIQHFGVVAQFGHRGHTSPQRGQIRRAEVEAAGFQHQMRAAFPFQRAPEGKRIRCQRRIFVFGMAVADNTAGPVAAALLVPDLKLFQQQHAPPIFGQVVSSGGADSTGADDDDIVVGHGKILGGWCVERSA